MIQPQPQPQPRLADPRILRARIRDGLFDGPTAGLCGDALQANLVILPGEEASDFLRFCQANPRPCPLLAVYAKRVAGNDCAKSAAKRQWEINRVR